jgi:hypothetical protein
VPDQPYSPGPVLSEDPGHGVNFTQFVTWIRESRFEDIEKLFKLSSPTPWLREWLIRAWWGYYSLHVKAIDQPAYKEASDELARAVKKITAIKSHSGTVALLAPPNPQLISQFAGKHRGRGRRSRLEFERLVLCLAEPYHHLVREWEPAPSPEYFYRFIEQNIRVLLDLEPDLKPTQLQFPRKQRQILKSLQQIARRSERISQ